MAVRSGYARPPASTLNAALVGAGWALADGDGLACAVKPRRGSRVLASGQPGAIRPDAWRSRF